MKHTRWGTREVPPGWNGEAFTSSYARRQKGSLTEIQEVRETRSLTEISHTHCSLTVRTQSNCYMTSWISTKLTVFWTTWHFPKTFGLSDISAFYLCYLCEGHERQIQEAQRASQLDFFWRINNNQVFKMLCTCMYTYICKKQFSECCIWDSFY